MRILSAAELINTRRKLAALETQCQRAQRETGGDEELREMEIESLTRLINQLKEEISGSEAHLLTR